MARRTTGGVPVAVFRRVPGIPPVAVTRLPDWPLTPQPLPGPQTHTHDFLVLLYAHRAGGSFLIDDRMWTAVDGDLFVIAPSQVLSFPEPADRIVEDGWVVFFPADVIRSGAYSWRAHPLLFPFACGTDRAQRLRVPPEQRPGWVERITALDGELRTRRTGWSEASLAHLMLLLVATARLAGDVAGELRSANEPLLAAVFDVIEHRFTEPISLAEVAAELALTPGYLTTSVRRRTGRTVQQWLTERRMQEARRLLTETDLTVTVIAHRVGYLDVSYFIRRFRAEHQSTPALWRRG
jgi:AraC family transcriptional activator of pobA